MRHRVILSTLLLAACSSSTTIVDDGSVDGSVPDGFVLRPDFGPAIDMGMPVDAPPPVDLGTMVDMTVPPTDSGVVAVCGNMTLEPPEQCDDGNTVDGDGCSATCTVEGGTCPGGATATPITSGMTVTGDTSTGGRTSSASGSCGGGSAPEDVYTFTVYTQSDVTVTTDLGGTAYDTAVYIRSACGDRMSEAGCRSAGPMGDTVALSGVTPGTYYVFVDGTAGANGAYQLSVTVTPRIPDGGACDPAGTTGRCADGSMCVGGICTSAMAACTTTAATLTPGTPVMDTTVGGIDVYGPACSSDGMSPELVYHVHVDPGMHDLVLTATPTNFAADAFDIVLTVETTCGDAMSAIDCSDSMGAMSAETVTVPNASGDYYVVVDGYGRTPTDMTAGQFTLTATLVDIIAVGGTCDPMGITNHCAMGLVCTTASGASTCVDPTVAACAGAVALTSGTAVAGTLTGTGGALAPGCGPDRGTPENVYSITVPAGGGFLRAHATGLGAGSDVYVRGPDTCADTAEMACADLPRFGGGGTADATTGSLAAGTYDVIVDGTGTYMLTVTVGTTIAMGGTCTATSTTAICAMGTACIGGTCQTVTTLTDMPPNARFCDAQGPVTGDTLYTGSLDNMGTDFDTIEVTLAAAAVLAISTSDGAGGCVTDTYVEVFSAGAMTCGALDGAMPTPIAMDDDSGLAPFCSALTTASLAAGTYYVRARRPPATPGPAGPYVLLIDVM